jgi:hypothetical protein
MVASMKLRANHAGATMKRTPVDEEVRFFTLNICETSGHEHCPGFTTLSAGEIKLGPVACICECPKVWLLKNSFSAKTASNPVIENVYPARENRL